MGPGAARTPEQNVYTVNDLKMGQPSCKVMWSRSLDSSMLPLAIYHHLPLRPPSAHLLRWARSIVQHHHLPHQIRRQPSAAESAGVQMSLIEGCAVV